MSKTLSSTSVEQTLAIGQQLGQLAKPNDVIALAGPLGSGKTVLVKGIARGVAVADLLVVNSPTYCLVNEYAGRLLVYHIDVYRLDDADTLAALGFDEMCSAGGLVVIEWADKVTELLPQDHLWVRIRASAPEKRAFDLAANGPAAMQLLRSVTCSEKSS